MNYQELKADIKAAKYDLNTKIDNFNANMGSLKNLLLKFSGGKNPLSRCVYLLPEKQLKFLNIEKGLLPA